MKPTKFLLTLEALTHIAHHAKQQAVSGKAVCEALDLSPRYLEAVLQELAHHHILRSVRGPKGGYVLACDRRKLTLDQIYQIVKTVESQNKEKTTTSPTINTLWEKIEADILSSLGEITLETLCNQVPETNENKETNFTI